jgi:HSP20 family molecular chaperone IbpA
LKNKEFKKRFHIKRKHHSSFYFYYRYILKNCNELNFKKLKNQQTNLKKTMSLISHTFFPRSAFDMDFWLRPENLLSAIIPPGLTTLDIFDPFDELDRVMSRNLMWLEVPDVLKASIIMPPQQPSVPSKYRIQVQCAGFSPSSIKTQLSEDKRQLVVSAKEGGESQPGSDNGEDFYLREFRRTYTLPENANTDQLISFVTSNNRLIIEMPVREEKPLLEQPSPSPQIQPQQSESSGQLDEQQQPPQPQTEKPQDEFPPIAEQQPSSDSEAQTFKMSMGFPVNINPDDVKVICKVRSILICYALPTHGQMGKPNIKSRKSEKKSGKT